ncbi:MAG: hypothetical protein IH588_17025 [Anaerolineales bacterium]|nr:hypothetical protein [Anaerolineales bacterium]
MRSKNKTSILLAVAALVVSTLACALGDPTLSNVRVAKDQDGTQVSSIFSPTDTIYVVSDLSNGVAGNVVRSKWTIVSVQGYDPGFVIDEVDLTLDKDQLSYTVYFYFEPPEGGWPVGVYQVEVLFNGASVSTTQFIVQ